MAVIFLSHSTRNKEIALQVQSALEAAHHTVFVDSDHETGIAAGTDWLQELFRSINASNAIVFLNSTDSQASKWCHMELAFSIERKKWIYSVNLDPNIGPHELLSSKQGIRLEKDLAWSLQWLADTLTKEFAGRNASIEWDKTKNPYPGLDSFDASLAGVFFGRDGAIDDVVRRLDELELTNDGSLLALVGPSGSGKSSLVKAGVLPRLTDRGDVLLIGPFEPGNYPTDRLLAALRSAGPAVLATLTAEQLRTDGLARTVARLLDERPDARRAVITIDQFEYLGSASEAERATFLELVDAAVAPGSKLTVILIARQDQLETIQRFAPLGKRITAPHLVVPKDIDGLRLAIEQPAAAALFEVDPHLTEKIVDDATDHGRSDTGRALPLVAATLRAIFEEAKAQKRTDMSLADYEKVGGVNGAIGRLGDAAEAQLKDSLPALRRLLPRFVVQQDEEHQPIGQPLALHDLGADETDIVKSLQQVRLVTADDSSARLVHDRLIEAWPLLKDIVQTQRSELLFRSQLERQAGDWEKGTRNEFLLGPESTEKAEALIGSETGDLSGEVTHYVAASQDISQ